MKYTDELFSMIREVSYLTSELGHDMLLRNLVSSAASSMVDVPKYYVLQSRLDKIREQYRTGSIWNNTSTEETYLRKRGGFGTSPVKDAHWQLSEMKQGMPLDEPMPLNPPEFPDGLEHAYQEGLKAMGAHYSGSTIKFRRYKPLDETPIPMGYVPLEKEGLTFNDTEVCRHQYNMMLKAMDESLDKGIGFGVMLESLKEVGDKKDFPPNWGKI